MEIGFSLGSNLGDRLGQLTDAKRRLLAVSDTTLLAQSAVYETEPVGVEEPYKSITFLNAVLILGSDRSAHEWLVELGRIETDMGRVRTGDRNAPRPIDIDILYAGDVYIDDGGLVVPHPRWAERRFVVEPLAEVRPDRILPGTGKTVREVLSALPEDNGVTRFTSDW